MKNIRNLIKTIKAIFRKKFSSPSSYPKMIGVNIGDNCFTPDKDTWSSEPYLITVGNHCQITVGVRIFTHGGGQAVRHLFPEFDTFGEVKIGNFVYIGNNSLIMPGVSIGDNVLIAAGSVVTKSIPSGYVVGGNPAKIICSIENYIEKNKQYNLNSKCMSPEQKKHFILSLPQEKKIKKPFFQI